MPEAPKPRIQHVRASDLKIDPKLTPKRDETFLERLQKAVKGEIPVFFAQVPLRKFPYDCVCRSISIIDPICIQSRRGLLPK